MTQKLRSKNPRVRVWFGVVSIGLALKKIIGGVVYDTETAENIATGSHRHELSDAWWRLYRTSSGVFFEVVADHDGVVTEFVPLTDIQARRFLEVNANSLVERYFGPMPEAKRSLFSRRTVISAIDVLEIKLTKAEISSLFIDFGSEIYQHLPECGSAKIRMVELKKFIDRNPLSQVDGNIIENELVERAIRLLPALELEYPWFSVPHSRPEFDRLRHALGQDGFVISDGELRRELPSDVGLPAIEADLVRLLDKHGLVVAKGHLDQALKNHAAGNWAAANSQIRSFMESLFDELAVKSDGAAASKKPGQERRSHLANLSPPLLDRALNEWGDNGVGFINGLMARLHPQGSHPGLSGEEDSTFRLHIVLLTANFFLQRFDREVH
ncbi:hypothetical protein [Breoghania sp.]|uniref:hypothetical protein n=1 Tax=Breoghania sp. TaxID=2065378 RepID=UPI002AAAB916|nr:hypothetical protein [Breoghania sp.]